MQLRPLHIEDAPLMLEWMHDSSVVDNLAADFQSKNQTDCEEFICRSLEDQKNLNLAVTGEDNIYMGTVSLKNIDYERKSAEFAISMRRSAMGTGLAQFGMAEIIRIGLEELGLRQVYWCVSRSNTRAVRFYDKCGYPQVSEKTIRVADVGAMCSLPDMLYYAINK